MSDMSRKEAIKQLRLLKGDITFGIASKVENKNQIEALSIAIASLETDEAYQLEYERTTKNDLGVDCISRFEVTEILNSEYDIDKMLDRVDDLPSVTPIRPKGRWIWCVGSHKCSNCEEYTCFSHKELLRYCPNCGAKMESEEE